MRPVLTLTILATLTAACATPHHHKRPVVVRRAPTVVVHEQPVVVTQAPDYQGSYPMAGGGHESAGVTTTTTTTTTGTFTPMTYPHQQKNPVPGSVREYINRYPSGGAMAK